MLIIMYKKLLKLSVCIASVAIVLNSCSKDANNSSSGNSTNNKTTAVFNPSIKYGSLTDKDGNVYKTVTIGTQTWMAENLRTTKYNDGTKITNYLNYKNTTNDDTIATYGRLYNWDAVSSGNLAPAGWHVPSNDEWTTLITYLGGSGVAGGKLKEAGKTHWKNQNIAATNESGFTALPAGEYFAGNGFYDLGSQCKWWTSSVYLMSGTGYAWYRTIVDYAGSISYDNDRTSEYFSVRCVKNN